MSQESIAMPSVANATRIGTKMYNEDASFSQILTAPEARHVDTPPYVCVLGVSDGHGENGEGIECAEYCMAQLPIWVTSLFQQSWTDMDWNTEATRFTAQLHREYLDICAANTFRLPHGEYRTIKDGVILQGMKGAGAIMKPVRSGATLSVTLTFPINEQFRTITLQVGDSDIYINGRVVACNHSPTNPEEYMRVKELPKGHRFSYHLHGRTYVDIFNAEGKYDPRYYNAMDPHTPWNWSRGISPCTTMYDPSVYLTSRPDYPYHVSISVTRAIGNYYATEGGIITDPHVTIQDIPTCPIICIGSDGLWDTLDKNQRWMSPKWALVGHSNLFNLVEHELTLQECVEQRVYRLHDLYKELFGFTKADDISMAVLMPPKKQ
jgi:serine/threonine protein phosphatase PrpC